MKWKNLDVGASFYYITGTFTEWLPLLANPDIRSIVCSEISDAIKECGGYVSAYVIMPDHLHLLVFLPEQCKLHTFNKLWRGRSSRRIGLYTLDRKNKRILDVFARHANGHSRYAVCKEQVRSLPINTEKKLKTIVNYIHNNPVRRRLVDNPADWEFSSFSFYINGKMEADSSIPLTMME